MVFIRAAGLIRGKDRGDNPISKELRQLLDALGIGGQRNFSAAVPLREDRR